MTISGEPRRRQSPTGEWQYQGPDGYWYDEPQAEAKTEAEADAEATRAPVSAEGPASLSQSENTASSVPVGAWMAIIGSVVVAIGTLLPWATESIGSLTVTRNAFQLGDHQSVTYVGPLVVVLAVIGILIGTARLTGAIMPRGLQTSAMVLGLAFVILIALNYPLAPSGLSGLVTFTVGFGFWLSVIGGVVVFLGGLVMRTKAESADRASGR